MADAEMLNETHGIPGQLEFRAIPEGLTIAEVENSGGSATVSIQGAQVLAWAPHGMEPVLWLSREARPAPGKAVRGGIPVCWPWFGPHVDRGDFPNHGFARTARWQVLKAETRTQRETHLVLRLEYGDESRDLWPHPFALECDIRVGRSLELTLTTFNPAKYPITVTEALHAYFSVGDVRQLAIQGLDGCAYVDKVNGGVLKRQSGAVAIDSEVDRIYVDTVAECVIEDPVQKRRVGVLKKGSKTTVLWNPWADKAAALGDFGDDGYLEMVCVETANADRNAVTVLPGQTHRMTARYRVDAL